MTSTPSKERRPPVAAVSTRLSFWTIVVIAANTMNGPGLTTLPSISHAAGQVTLVGLICTSTLLTCYVVKRLCLLMWSNHHNHSSDSTDESTSQVHYPTLEESDMVALAQDAFVTKQQPHTTHNKLLNNKTNAASIRQWTALAMIGCALALALAQMMLCAKIADAMIVASLGSACGFGMNPVALIKRTSMHCTSQLSMQPFSVPVIVRSGGVASRKLPEGGADDDSMETREKLSKDKQRTHSQPPSPPVGLVTGGLVLASAITVSLASVDLDSMVNAQFALFGCLLLACLRFCFVLNGTALSSLTTATSNDDVSGFLWLGDRPLDAVGPVLFNFAFVVTAPPLSCGAQGGSLGAIRALTTACIIMGSLYAILGWMGAPAAAAAKEVGEDTNLLSLILQGAGGKSSWLDNLSVIVFGISQLAAIPVYCELAKETLEAHVATAPLPTTATVLDHGHRIPPKSHATSWLSDYSFYLCHVAPWLICAFTYNSTLFESFVEWSSLLLLGFCNFSLPLLLEICIKEKQQPRDGFSGGSRELKGLKKRSGSVGPVLWIFSITTATITAVIVQRLTGSLLLAEGAFMMTVLGVINYI